MLNENALNIEMELWYTKGYKKYSDGLHAFLSKQPFYNDIDVVPVKDRGITGNFIVTIEEGRGRNIMIHSNKHGKGRASTDSERRAIADQIQMYLDDQE